MRIKRAYLTFVSQVIMAIVAGIILHLLLVRHIKNTINTNFIGVEFYFSQTPEFQSTLYYSYTDKFKAENKVIEKKGLFNAAIFQIPKSDRLPTNFRLDFGNKPGMPLMEIDSMFIKFGDNIFVLNQEELFEHIFTNSASVKLNKSDHSINMMPNTKPFDPYIVFDPLVSIILARHPFRLPALLLPFIIIVSFYIKKWYLKYKPSPFEIILLLFIICIPLKIAWTTFLSLLICLYAIVLAIRDRKFNFKNQDSILLATIFFLLLAMGRPTEFNLIDNQLALLVFSIIIGSTSVKKQRIFGAYVYFFLILNALFVTSGLSFLLEFNSVFGLSIGEYFSEIKIYSGNIRNWLYYDHAVFLTFFGIIGLLPLELTSKFSNQKPGIAVLYHVLLISTIVLFGARISLLIYLIFLINILLKLSMKRLIVFNASLFLFSAILLFYFIGNFDNSRLDLWSVSWEAIKEKPLFGYGLGNSDKMLHNPEFMLRGGAEIPKSLNHSHNQFLTFLSEIGFIGLISLVITIGIYLRRVERNKMITMVLFIFGLSYVFLTESILQTSKPLFVLCFLFMMLTSMPANKITNEFDKET
jgi:O-antigen ligase